MPIRSQVKWLEGSRVQELLCLWSWVASPPGMWMCSPTWKLSKPCLGISMEVSLHRPMIDQIIGIGYWTRCPAPLPSPYVPWPGSKWRPFDDTQPTEPLHLVYVVAFLPSVIRHSGWKVQHFPNLFQVTLLLVLWNNIGPFLIFIYFIFYYYF